MLAKKEKKISLPSIISNLTIDKMKTELSAFQVFKKTHL